jgi:hypothetical protein
MPRTRPSAPPELSAQRRPPHHHINPADEFRRHAAECQRMAKLTRDRESRETWNRLAERWTQVAERFQHEREAVHRPPLRYRKPPPGWAAEH